MTKIVKNSIKCKHCGDVIESYYTHDFKFCSCGKVAVDGGRSYLKRSAQSLDDFEDMSVCEDVPEETTHVAKHQSKYRCPICGGFNVVIAEESTTRRFFKVRANGKRYKKAYDTCNYYTDEVVEYLLCTDCYAEGSLEDKKELATWENVWTP